MTQGEFQDVIEEKKKETKPCPCEKSDGTKIDTGTDANGECLPCEEEQTVDVPKKPAEFWLQDNLKTAGAFANLMDIKKYTPWAAKYDLQTPKPTFMDPTRELAANAEQANIQSQALAQFAGPQALSARASGVMGAASKNAADIMSRYNNANVNLANQFESNIANINNQEQQLNSAASQKLYDQNTIANQQYDNSKRQARNQLLNQYTNAITNKWKTDAMNQLYPQYGVTPGNGGEMTFDREAAKKIKPVTSKSISDYIAECKADGLSDENAIMKCVAQKTGAAGKDDTDDTQAATVMAQYSNQGNQQLPKQKHGGFMYSDIIYPFVL
jgi:hypothetical protein